MGHAVLFSVVETIPDEIVKILKSTELRILPHPVPDPRELQEEKGN
jgi:hypothetical protein